MLLSLGCRGNHILTSSWTEGLIHQFQSTLECFFIVLNCILRIERQADAVVLEYVVHQQGVVNEECCAYVWVSHVDDFADFAWLDAEVETCVDKEFELVDGITADSGCKDTHHTRFLQHEAFRLLEGLIESEIIYYFCEFGVGAQAVDLCS